MKKLKQLILTAVCVGSAMMPLYAYAQTDNISEQTTTQQTTVEQVQARIAERKAARAEKLDAAKLAKVTERCVAAQEKVATHLEVVSQVVINRQKIHTSLIERLEAMSAKLKDKTIDTAELDLEVANLKNLISDFDAKTATYKDALSDTKTIDCATDPEGFMASLDDARTQAQSARESAQAIRQYFVATIVPTLQNLKQTLASQESSATQQQTTNPEAGDNAQAQ